MNHRNLAQTHLKSAIDELSSNLDPRRTIPDIFRQSNQFIAGPLGRHASTIKRELHRNLGENVYRPQQAYRFAQERHQLKPKAIKMTEGMKVHIRERLVPQWSPEQIQGRMKTEDQEPVCPKTIDDFIEQDKVDGGDLHKNLRHKRYRQLTSKPDARGQLRNRISIDDRPDTRDQKLRIVDWEADTVIGKGL